MKWKEENETDSLKYCNANIYLVWVDLARIRNIYWIKLERDDEEKTKKRRWWREVKEEEVNRQRHDKKNNKIHVERRTFNLFIFHCLEYIKNGTITVSGRMKEKHPKSGEKTESSFFPFFFWLKFSTVIWI